MDTAKEKFFLMNTMLCLLKCVEGKRTTVELRDEKEITGEVTKVDGYMNITMHNVTYKSPAGTKRFDSFFVNGKSIRYVHIPDDINMKTAMESKIKEMCPHEASLRVHQQIKDEAWKKLKLKENQAKKKLAKEQKE